MGVKNALSVVVASICVLGATAGADARSGSGMIAFQVYGESTNAADGICLVNADGSGLHRLAHQPPNGFAPRWSPDGRKLLVGSFAKSSVRLYVIGVDGTNRRLLLVGHGAGQTPGYADWSPDGTRIAVLRGTPCRNFLCKASLYEFSVASRAFRRVAANVAGFSPPAWSPNGRLIAFTDQSGALQVVEPSGRNRRRLAGGLAAYPAWSPDGRTIAFTAIGNTTGAYTIGADGRNLKRLLPGDGAAVSWSPNGERVVFVRNSDNGDLYTADGNGKSISRLTSDPRDETLPDWQPAP